VIVDTGSATAALLAESGVRRFYTVPGESFLEILDGADRHPEIRLISTRHESGASFMAEADAKMTGRPAVVAATRGVGAANLAIGVHTAYQDSTPMIVFLGQVDSHFLGREGFQEVDLPAFYRPITKWAVTAHRTDRITELVAQAVRISQAGRPGPVMIAFPADVLAADIDAAAVDLGRRRLGMDLAVPAPSPAAMSEIAERLTRAERPVIIAGKGAQHARDALVHVAEKYSAGVYASFRRQDVFPNDHPLYLGHLGIGVSGARLNALRGADLVLVLGSRLSEITTFGYTLPGPQSEVIQIDVDAAVIGAVAPVSLGVVADGLAALEMLWKFPDASAHPPRDWSAAHAAYLSAAAIPPSRATMGVDPARVIAAMADVLPADTVIANDAGNFSAFLHQHWLYRAAASQVAPTSGAMGYAVPAAIGAKIAAPDRTVVGLAGDGGFSMSAMEIETAVREGVDVTYIVFRNGLQGTIAMHQARSRGRLSGVRIGPMDIAGLATSLGAHGVTVAAESDLRDALRAAVAVPGPSVVEVLTDPEVLSPSTTLSALLGGAHH
jgi:acetolactate synthase I/II/III large subunit